MCWLKPGDVVYSIGVGGDISYDVGIAAQYGVIVRLFDPTPNAINHVDAVIDTLLNGRVPEGVGDTREYKHRGQPQDLAGQLDEVASRAWFQSVLDSSVSPGQLQMHSAALGDDNGELLFYRKPWNPVRGSYTLVRPADAKDEDAIRVPVYTLEHLMRVFGDDDVQLVKIDIEGSEVTVLPQIIDALRLSGKPHDRWPKVIAVDMDSMREGHRAENKSGASAAIRYVKSHGYSTYANTGADYVFLLDPTPA